MNTEGIDGNGSMYGIVDSMRNATAAMEQLIQFLPADSICLQVFMRPLAKSRWSGRRLP